MDGEWRRLWYRYSHVNIGLTLGLALLLQVIGIELELEPEPEPELELGIRIQWQWDWDWDTSTGIRVGMNPHQFWFSGPFMANVSLLVRRLFVVFRFVVFLVSYKLSKPDCSQNVFDR